MLTWWSEFQVGNMVDGPEHSTIRSMLTHLRGLSMLLRASPPARLLNMPKQNALPQLSQGHPERMLCRSLFPRPSVEWTTR